MRKKWKQWQIIFLASKITADSDCNHEIKRSLLFRRKTMANQNRVLKSRYHFPDEVTYSQSYDFSSSHVCMWELDHKESWLQKNWCFWTVVLEKAPESPLDCKEIKPLNSKGNQSWIFIGKTDAEAEAPILWPSDAKNWLLGKDPDAGKDRKQRGEGDDREWDGWMPSLNQWTWVWASSGR